MKVNERIFPLACGSMTFHMSVRRGQRCCYNHSHFTDEEVSPEKFSPVISGWADILALSFGVYMAGLLAGFIGSLRPYFCIWQGAHLINRELINES